MKIRALPIAAVLILSAPAVARAADQSTAEVLFVEGRKLLKAGDYAAACPKLEASWALEPGTGTLGALALCHERIGRIASAWSEYAELVAKARREGRPDRERFARERVADLEPRLSHLTITVDAGDGVTVTRDGAEVAQAAWGVAIPVDPGLHVVRAEMSGKESWETTITVGQDASAQTVEVPPLVDVPAPAVVALPLSTPVTIASHPAWDRRPYAIAVGGAGIAAIAVGSAFGLEALSTADRVRSACPRGVCTSQADVQANSSGRTQATIADVALGVGAVGVAAGAYLYLSQPKVSVTPTIGGVIVRGFF
jgi:hypothetical protein